MPSQTKITPTQQTPLLTPRSPKPPIFKTSEHKNTPTQPIPIDEHAFFDEMDKEFNAITEFEDQLVTQYKAFRELIKKDKDKLTVILRTNAVEEFLKSTENSPNKAAYVTLHQDLLQASKSPCCPGTPLCMCMGGTAFVE
jgi:hypothetical protein